MKKQKNVNAQHRHLADQIKQYEKADEPVYIQGNLNLKRLD